MGWRKYHSAGKLNGRWRPYLSDQIWPRSEFLDRRRSRVIKLCKHGLKRSPVEKSPFSMVLCFQFGSHSLECRDVVSKNGHR